MVNPTPHPPPLLCYGVQHTTKEHQHPLDEEKGVLCADLFCSAGQPRGRLAVPLLQGADPVSCIMTSLPQKVGTYPFSLGGPWPALSSSFGVVSAEDLGLGKSFSMASFSASLKDWL